MFCHTGAQDKANEKVLKSLGLTTEKSITPSTVEKIEVKVEPEAENNDAKHVDSKFDDDSKYDAETNDDFFEAMEVDDDYEPEEDEDCKDDLDFLPLKPKKPARRSSKRNGSYANYQEK